MSYCLVSFRGHEAPAWVLEAVADGRVPGVCLFAFNFRDLEQFAALTGSLRAAARAGGQPPPLIGIDQEGGQLMAIGGGATELPGNMALGATRSAELARAAGRILGTELRDLGVNLNFAPVLDLATRPENPVVGLRAFGDDPDLVSRLGAAMIEGMQATGVLACAKHFPGHGDTLADSHHAPASVEKTLDELLALELRPFQAAFDVGLAAVMTAHVRYPLLEEVPATFSEAVLTRLLRGRLRYDGLLITDALDMHALAGVAPRERARQALEAGADLALLGHLPDQQAMVEELLALEFPEATRRIARARERLAEGERTAAARQPGSHLDPASAVRAPFDWSANAVEAEAMARAAITVVSGQDELPLRLGAGDRLCVVTVTAGNLTPAETVAGGAGLLAEQVQRRHADVVATEFAFGASAGAVAGTVPGTLPGAVAGTVAGLDAGTGVGSGARSSAGTDAALDEAVERVLAKCRGAAAVLLATVDASADESQRRLFARLVEGGQRPYVLALRSPADAAVLSGARAVLCSYGRREVQTEAAVAVLFGERPAPGRLPLALAAPVETAAPEGVRV